MTTKRTRWKCPRESQLYYEIDDSKAFVIMTIENRVDVDAPLWDQSTFYGRFRHFAWMTNPLNTLASDAELMSAKQLVDQFRKGQEPPETTQKQLINAMKLYQSSFHPDTGELQNVCGRMCFQVPGGMTITGAMLQFYKTVPQIVFWQWFNQSFNALVNFTNRNAESPVSKTQLAFAYASATFSALGTAIGLKKGLEKLTPPVVQRFVPFVAVGAANCVNIPLMRQTELLQGVDLRDEDELKVCSSKFAAQKGITQVVISRNILMAPGMVLVPVIMQRLEKRPWFARMTFLHAPFQDEREERQNEAVEGVSSASVAREAALPLATWTCPSARTTQKGPIIFDGTF
ncbi:sideroflexin-2-like isoform X3 [Tigriopus californicus]|uniref:sideroflexin-2-like isoform X3 n=1 Tax=Tigriopus californicus TaxID=6832 RepID=UPI0027DA93D5|nr:sideroflexin-2-like isoform X3 [Tigriopus californicus]